MTSIPGLPLQIKITIQQKINKIIHQHFISPCPHHINITSSFQTRLLQTLSSPQTCILNAKLSNNIKHKAYSNLNTNHLLTCKPYLKTPKHLLNILYEAFSNYELEILLNHLEAFIPNEYVRKYFPKIKKETIEDVFGEDNDNSSYTCRDKQLPLIIPNEVDNELLPELNEDTKRKIKECVDTERKRIIEKNKQIVEAEKHLHKMLSEMNWKINNIENYSEQFVKKHPLVEYYVKKKKKIKEYNRSVSVPLMRMKGKHMDKDKFKKLVEENKRVNVYLNKITSNYNNKNVC